MIGSPTPVTSIPPEKPPWNPLTLPAKHLNRGSEQEWAFKEIIGYSINMRVLLSEFECCDPVLIHPTHISTKHMETNKYRRKFHQTWSLPFPYPSLHHWSYQKSCDPLVCVPSTSIKNLNIMIIPTFALWINKCRRKFQWKLSYISLYPACSDPTFSTFNLDAAFIYNHQYIQPSYEYKASKRHQLPNQ